MILLRSYHLAIEAFLHRFRLRLVHGAELRDLLMEHYPGSGCAVDSDDMILRELVREQIILPAYYEPTLSQRAWRGLAIPESKIATVLERDPFPAGMRSHFYFRPGPWLLAELERDRAIERFRGNDAVILDNLLDDLECYSADELLGVYEDYEELVSALRAVLVRCRDSQRYRGSGPEPSPYELLGMFHAAFHMRERCRCRRAANGKAGYERVA